MLHGYMKMNQMIEQVLGPFQFKDWFKIKKTSLNDVRPTDMLGCYQVQDLRKPNEITAFVFSESVYGYTIVTEKYGDINILPINRDGETLTFSVEELNHIIECSFDGKVIQTIISFKNKFNASIVMKKAVPKKDPPKKGLRIVQHTNGLD